MKTKNICKNSEEVQFKKTNFICQPGNILAIAECSVWNSSVLYLLRNKETSGVFTPHKFLRFKKTIDECFFLLNTFFFSLQNADFYKDIDGFSFIEKPKKGIGKGLDYINKFMKGSYLVFLFCLSRRSLSFSLSINGEAFKHKSWMGSLEV